MASEGVTFCEALRKKYCPAMFEYDLNNMQISPNKREIILKQQNHKNRLCLILDGCQVHEAGDEGEIENTCPLLKELDLSNNLLQDMVQVCSIADQLKQLSFINLSANPLHDVSVSDPCFHNGSCYPNVDKLILNNTGMPFDTMCKLLHLFPRVNELHASINRYGQVPETKDTFPTVESLLFSKNEIFAWADIERLGATFPHLKTLIVSENPVDEIPLSSHLESLFPHLEKLSIAKTLISDWQSLDQLNRIPHLTDIRFSQIPLLDTWTDPVLLRQLLIARLPKMKTMNGGLIEPQEREDAERAFIRHYKNLDDKPDRYCELVKVHGELMDLVQVCMEAPSHTILNIKGDVSPECQLKVNLQQRTGELKKLIAQKFGLDVRRFRMFYTNITGFAEEMKQNSKKLYLYRFSDVDDIHVQRLDLEDDDIVPTSPRSLSESGS